MRNRLRMAALVAGLFLAGASRAETDAFDAERFLDVRGAETFALIAADLSGPFQGAALDRAEPAGEAEALVAALDRAESAEDIGPIVDGADLAATATTTDEVTGDVAGLTEPSLDMMGALVESTGSIVAGATAAEPAAANNEALVAVVETGEATSAHAEPSLVPSEPVEPSVESVEPTAGP